MSLIVRPSKNLKKQIRLTINGDLFSRIKQYCDWLDISMAIFMEQAAENILVKDKDFKKHRSQQSLQQNSGAIAEEEQ